MSKKSGLVRTVLTWVFVLLAAICIVALWYRLGVLNFESFANSEEASRYGDSFGYVNSLISALAFFGVVVAILLQMTELKLQREELELTRGELAKSAEAQSQLVNLSALSTLLQTYLEEYRSNRTFHDGTFQDLLEKRPEMAAEHICYKIIVCRSMLERMYREAARQPLGKPVDTSIEHIREERWLSMLYSSLREYEQQWIRYSERPEHKPPSATEVRHFFNACVGSFNDLLAWVEAVERHDTWRNHLELASNSLRSIELNIGEPKSIKTHHEGVLIQLKTLKQAADSTMRRIVKQEPVG